MSGPYKNVGAHIFGPRLQVVAPVNTPALNTAYRVGFDAAQKYGAVHQLLANHREVLVHLNATVAGVDVPAHLRRERLALRIGVHLTPPIPDLTLGPDALVATLTFNGSPYTCVVPWYAVYALTDERAGDLIGAWPADAPEGALKKTEPVPARPKLSLVPEDGN